MSCVLGGVVLLMRGTPGREMDAWKKVSGTGQMPAQGMCAEGLQCSVWSALKDVIYN